MISSYRQLRSLRANFEELINIISKIGYYDKQTSLLETKIDQEKSRISINNSQRINDDLKEVIDDNNKLINMIKLKSAGK